MSHLVGTPTAFILAILLILIWLLSGPAFSFSERWHLFINSVTTIVTFFMVFLIQNTQNRETESIQLKLDELLMRLGDKSLLDIEELTEEERIALKEKFKKYHESLRKKDR